MCLANVCLMQRTTYSVSASVSCTGSEDLKSGPRPWNSGIAASCSVNKKKRDGRSEWESKSDDLESDNMFSKLTLINVLA